MDTNTDANPDADPDANRNSDAYREQEIQRRPIEKVRR
jgi:hypothetical protein